MDVGLPAGAMGGMGDAVGAGDLVVILGAGGLRQVAPGALLAPALAASTANATAILGLMTRLAALEGRPAPVVRFPAVPVTLGALTIGTREWALKVIGVRAGDLLVAEPAGDLPPGVAIAYAHAPAADTVELALYAGAAVTVAAPIPFVIAAVRG